MIVADTSALISLATGDVLETVLSEFDVHTTQTVIDELEETAEYEDRHAKAAQRILDRLDVVTVHKVENTGFQSSRIDEGEGSCVHLVRTVDADFLITDDFRALPELQTLTKCRVAISPIVLNALIQREILDREEALNKLDELAEQRDWLGAPIYRKARDLFE